MSDLATLFATDPLKLTRDDIKTIVEAFRKSRHAFSLGNTKAGSTKPKTPKQKEVSALAEKLNISL